ncbi:MAG: CDP-alcohol phosphatidyltransferase family protein [Pseudomonadota bacterium]
MTLYDLKPRFQALLRPTANRIKDAGVTANNVTILAAVLSVLLGGTLTIWGSKMPFLFLLLPVWLIIRMALNALDGILAREFGDESPLGAYLNELGDQISDIALILPFAFLATFATEWVFAIVVLCLLSEFAGVAAALVGSQRRYDGPLGKSDRALVFGTLGAWIGIAGSLPHWINFLMPILAVLLILTTVNRVRAGLASRVQRTSSC